jgi:hypothetical protein
MKRDLFYLFSAKRSTFAENGMIWARSVTLRLSLSANSMSS